MFKKHIPLVLALIIAMLANTPVFAAKTTPPILVATPTVADVTTSTATLGGEITSQGTDPIFARGIEWDTVSGGAGGVYTNSITEGGAASGVFTVAAIDLPANPTTIYFRAWAENEGNAQNIGYSDEASFTTLSAAAPPTLNSSTLTSLAAVTSSAATLGGNITATGGSSITDHGTVWNTGGTPTYPGDHPSSDGAVGPAIPPDYTFSILRSGLDTGTLIHFRSYAVNTNGTSYGPDNSFYTEPANSPASATIDNVGDTSFRINWPANPGGSGDGALVVVSINSITAVPTDGDAHAFSNTYGGGFDLGTSEFVVHRGTGETNVAVTGLAPSTGYNVAVFYSAGTGNGETGINYRQDTPAINSQTTNTPAVAPTVTVATPASPTTGSALLGGDVTDNGGAAVTENGIWWHTSSPPDSGGVQVPINSGDAPFSQVVNGLPAGDTIYVRAYATNSAGTSVSAVIETFQTLVALPTVTADDASSITGTSAILGGTITDGGCDPVPGCITARGTVWNTTGNPNIVTDLARALAEGGTSVGIPFGHERSLLPTGQLVYFRTYATNSAGTNYSTVKTFTPSEPPVLGPPTHANPNYFSAELGGIITSDGGNPILSRGTVWNTTGSPVIETDNPLAEGGTAVDEAFSHIRFYSTGNTIYYRAYATNAGGTGYSAENSFPRPTEPDEPATLVTFPRIAANSLRISWTSGNGEGRIVVIRQGTAPIGANPVDGTEYSADPDFNTGEDIGSGHKVVYMGTNAAFVVTGLTISTSYSVAVYEYAGTGTAIDYLQSNPAEGSESTNDIPVHNLDNNVECNQCHSHGTYSTYVPQDAELKTVCETCHRVGGVAAAKQEFDNHLSPGRNPAIDFVDCGYCHEVHNPNEVDTTQSEHSIDLVTRTNKSFLRANVDKYVATAATPAYLHTDQPLRETPHPDAPQDAITPDRAVEGGTDTTARGYCQVCHTLTKYHRSSRTTETDIPNPGDPLPNQCHDGEGAECPPTGEINCGTCHQHNNQFKGVGGSQTCIECHSGDQPPRPTITTQFDRASKHIIAGSAAITQPDCMVCHAGNHPGTDLVGTLNADDGTTIYYQLTPLASTTDTGEGELFEPHCMSCHDDGLASSLPTDSGPPTADQTESSPFINSAAPPVIGVDTWAGAGHNRPTSGSPTGTFGDNPVSCVGNGNNGCHASGHGTDSISLLANAAEADPAVGAAVNPMDFCINCHDADGPSSINVPDQFNKIGLDPDTGLPSDTNFRTESDWGGLVNQRHDVFNVPDASVFPNYTDGDQDYSLGVVTCSNCHSPHADNSTNIADPDTGLPLPDYAVTNTYVEDGQSVDYDLEGALDPINPEGSAGGFTEPDYIQFCLTCHDGNPPPGVTMDGSLRNLAEDHATDYHGGGAGSGVGASINKGGLKQPWVTAADYAAGRDPTAHYAALNCTTCHGTHGSDNIHNLRSSITVAGVQMEVGGDGNGVPLPSRITDPKVYDLPRTTETARNSGVFVQNDHDWGAWCSFCHRMTTHASKTEVDACTKGHKHGGGAF